MQLAQVGVAQVAQQYQLQVIQALYVDKMYWNGVYVHAGHYQNGLIVTDVTGQQYAYENGFLIGMSNLWNYEVVNGIQYVKHSYPDGSCVYSNEFSQFVVCA